MYSTLTAFPDDGSYQLSLSPTAKSEAWALSGLEMGRLVRSGVVSVGNMLAWLLFYSLSGIYQRALVLNLILQMQSCDVRE